MESTARKFRKSMLFFSKALLILAMTAEFTYVWWVHYPSSTYYMAGNYLVVGFYAVVLTAFASLYGGTKIGVLRLGEVIYSYIVTLSVVNLIAYAQMSFISRSLVNPLWLAIAAAVQLVTASIGSFYMNRLYFKMYPAREVAVVYSTRALARNIIDKMALKKDRYRVCVAVSEDIGYDEIIKAVEGYASVLFCDLDEGLRLRLFSYCSLKGKRVYVLPNFQDAFIRSSHMTQLFDTPVFYSKNSGISTEQMMLKRVMDMLISVVGLLLASPVMLIVAVCIKLYDRGPVFYAQDRLTLDGKIFRLYKFRSMVVDAESGDGARLSSVGDDRITPVGKIIRRIRFDELPQFINILKGDMSVVGPRPERPEIALQYQEVLPEFALRLRMKAGLTGNAQIYGRYNTSVRDKLLLDLLYIENYSIILDFKMLFMTIKILFMPESTEGVGEGETLPVDVFKKD